MYLGIDLGTSGVKALLIDADQEIDRLGDRAGRAVAPASRLVRAGSRRLDPRDGGSARRAEGEARRRTCRGQGHRPFRPHARRDAARCRRQGAASLHPLERHAQPRRGREARCRSALPEDHRQHRVSRLHRAEARLGRRTTSRRSSPRSLKVLLPKDYLRLWLTGEHMSEMSDSAGTSWLDVGQARLVGRNCLPPPVSTEKQMPRLVEGTEPAGELRAELASKWGMNGRRRRRRRGRGQCGLGLRHGHGQARPCLRLARHLGRALRRQRRLSAQSRKRRARLLPRPAGHLAPDGRHPVGDRLRSTGCRASPAKAPAT